MLNKYPHQRTQFATLLTQFGHRRIQVSEFHYLLSACHRGRAFASEETHSACVFRRLYRGLSARLTSKRSHKSRLRARLRFSRTCARSFRPSGVRLQRRASEHPSNHRHFRENFQSRHKQSPRKPATSSPSTPTSRFSSTAAW